jgi:hypothetical protein
VKPEPPGFPGIGKLYITYCAPKKAARQPSQKPNQLNPINELARAYGFSKQICGTVLSDKETGSSPQRNPQRPGPSLTH